MIALIVTPEGFPLAYEVLPGNTADKTTLRGMLRKIEAQYGKAERIWVMDRGIPTEEVLAEMRAGRSAGLLSGRHPQGAADQTGKGSARRSPGKRCARAWTSSCCRRTRSSMCWRKAARALHKERAMRRRKLKWLWARLKQIAAMDLDREELLMKLGAARGQARAAWRLIDVEVAPHGATFSFALNRKKLRQVRRREGRYLLRTNLCGQDPAELWQFYIQLVEVEAAFKNHQGRSATAPDLPSARSSASRRTSSSPSWPIACTSRCAHGSSRWRQASRPGPCSTNSPPCKCSTCTSQPPTAAR